ncbi:MAG TPA: SDR family NAD(P)-dependent oxidoreductase [Planctomycetota bacterium]|nr:SDR family NAD(P)-dependent oxidoreductase [Planctomycetota bacterium]
MAPELGGAAAFDLSGRVAVITGASAGIGAATARRLAARGMHLVLGARRVERQRALADELASRHGTRALSLPLDVADGASVTRFAEAAEAFAGEPGVHLLVNNAGFAKGVARIPTATEADERDWEAMLATNVLGLLRVTRRFVPGMLRRDAGHVINLGSLAGLETYEGGSVYCASKASVRIISKALRLELLGSQVRVCCINPGLAETEFSVVRLGSQEKADAVYAGMTPLTADDIAASIEWVATLPAVMNIEELDLQPVDQASAQKVHRRPR